jgi:hypothetical protein
MLTCDIVGHIAKECSENRLLAQFSDLNVVTPEEAWSKLEEADKHRDLDDIKQVLIGLPVLGQYRSRYLDFS